MKARHVAWGMVLVMTHLAAYFMAGAMHGGESTVARGASLEAARMASAKASERAPQEAGHAALLRELSASTKHLSRREYLALRRELFRDWIRRDLRGAMDMIYGVEGWGRFGDLSTELGDELERAIAERGREVWHWMDSGRYGSIRSAAYYKWIQALGKHGQQAVAIELLDELQRELPDDLLSETIATLAVRAKAEDLAALRKAWETLPEDHDERRKRASYDAARQVQLAKGNLDTLLAHESDPMMRQELAKSWAKQELDELAGAPAVEAFAKLPVELRPEALKALLTSKHHGGFPMAVEMINEIGRQNLWGDIPEDERQRLSEQAVFNYVGFGLIGDDMFAELAKLEDPGLRHYALMQSTGYSLLMSHSEDASLETLDRLPAGEVRDSVIAGLVEDDLENAFFQQLVDRVADEKMREELMKRLEGAEDGEAEEVTE